MKKSPASQLIEQEIEARGGLRFSDFMDLALYHPVYGYYHRAAPQRGRSGDYYTSLQVPDLFPRIMADVVIDLRASLDSDSFTLIEFGSGGGEFLEGLLSILKERKELKGITTISVDRSRSAREQIQRRLSRFPKCQVVEQLSDIELIGGTEGCVFSNEFFDALSFRRLRRAGSGWNEIFVTRSTSGNIVEELRPLNDPRIETDLNSLRLEWEESQEIELRPQIPSWYDDLAMNFYRGAIITFDYGYARPDLYSPHRSKGTWLCYHKHTTNQEPYERIGDQDITAHVDFTQLAEAGLRAGFKPEVFSSQGIFLGGLGSKTIETYLKESTEQNKKERIGAVQQLIHPRALGESFWVLVQTKDMTLPPSFSTLSNRIKRLV